MMRFSKPVLSFTTAMASVALCLGSTAAAAATAQAMTAAPVASSFGLSTLGHIQFSMATATAACEAGQSNCVLPVDGVPATTPQQQPPLPPADPLQPPRADGFPILAGLGLLAAIIAVVAFAGREGPPTPPVSP